ncbi:flagellin domain-containing protein [Parendozoicomonas sp. Alg238-R29]|uniref:flagellin domain-containing protein n=1 Tax=Parendozoicomonas sp. Alg238-R29 TaxID=2993446 RepID=UPI00248D9DBD|nr:flagellin domain-containing protein [Parendozoicomonas sp. Alg238-R29]
MSFSVNTNVFSLNAQRNLQSSQAGLQTALQRLSSGSRINSAKDDAAGLQIANRLTSQVRGLAVAVRNANDGISLAQTAEGALQESTNILQRLRELSLQSANGTNGAAQRDALDLEAQALTTELTRIADNTTFGGRNVLDGSFSAVNFQIGADANQTVALTIADADAAALGVDAIDIGDGGDAQAAIGLIDTALQTVDTQRATLGAFQNRLTSTISNLSNISENASASRGRIQDADFAVETANLAKYQVLQQAGTAILSQANATTQNVLSLLR